MKTNLLVFLVGAIVCSACVERAVELSTAEREQLRDNILREAPSPQHTLDISFENRARLIGYDIDRETVVPGQPFTITWYWHAQRRLDDGWQVFTHLVDSRGENRMNEDGTGLLRQLYQPGRWSEGEYLRDPQTITLPPDWNSDEVVFYLGLWNGPNRLAVTRGPNDGENRARGATIPVSGASARANPTPPAPATPPPSLRADRATDIRIDGQLDEASWQNAPSTSVFVNTVDGSAADLRANAKVLWNDERLYVAFDVTNDEFLRNTLTERDAHLWEQDAVEIMVDPDGDGQNYFELQVSPTAQVFDTRYDSRRVPQPIGHADWNATVETRVAARGTVNDDADDHGYTVEIAIPWQSFVTTDGTAMSAPPADSAWRMNFYVMDTMRQGQRSAGWSPTLERDFHVPARFGRVTFAPAPVAQAPAEAPAAAAVREIQLPPAAMEQLRRAMRPVPVAVGGQPVPAAAERAVQAGALAPQ
jgi:hypothetical protein